MTEHAYTKITYELEHNVAIVRLNDPGSLNALSSTMATELLDAFARAEGEARAMYLSSHGRAFSSGADLSEGNWAMDDPDRDVGVRLEKLFNPMIVKLRDFKIPIVVGVRGAAAGVGCAIALSGDVIVASDTGYFYQAFRHIGLVPDGGSSYLLARAIGRVRAMEMMLLGEKLPASKALEWGLITRVIADAELDASGIAIARQLAAGPRALGLIRKAAWAALDAPLEEQLHRERRLQRQAGQTSDFTEGVAAFREKRPAKFTGA